MPVKRVSKNLYVQYPGGVIHTVIGGVWKSTATKNKAEATKILKERLKEKSNALAPDRVTRLEASIETLAGLVQNLVQTTSNVISANSEGSNRVAGSPSSGNSQLENLEAKVEKLGSPPKNGEEVCLGDNVLVSRRRQGHGFGSC